MRLKSETWGTRVPTHDGPQCCFVEDGAPVFELLMTAGKMTGGET